MWTALTNTTFRERLLNGQRREVLATVNLTEAEQRAVLGVTAETLETFARALCQVGPSGV
jgi:hypothetical protein